MVARFAFAATSLFLTTAGVRAQTTPETPGATLTVRSTLVQVPVLVTTKKGEIVYELTAPDFLLTDDGVPQQLRLEQDTDAEPLALAIVVETGGAGAAHLSDYRDLDPLLENFVGAVDHRIAVIAFDSAPHLLLPFQPDVATAADTLVSLADNAPGDRGASLLDALALATNQLRRQPLQYRRAILLLSETMDQGSDTSLTEALRLISDTNTTVYSIAFSSTRSEIRHEASKFNNSTPGPQHGCFSKEGADAEYQDHYSAQVLDCISQLAPPLRLATMAFLAARNELRKNTAETVTHLTGGEFYKFHNTKDLQKDLIAATHDVPNRYILTFRPTAPTAGLHALDLKLKDRPDFKLRYRSEYWADSDPTPSPAGTPPTSGAADPPPAAPPAL